MNYFQQNIVRRNGDISNDRWVRGGVATSFMRTRTSNGLPFSFVLIVLCSVGCTNPCDPIPNAVQDFATSVADLFSICEEEIVVDLKDGLVSK